MQALYAVLATAPLVLELFLLYWISRRLAVVQVRIHLRWFYLNACVGTAIHETSHALGCVMTRTKIREFEPFSPRDDGTLGWVTHEKAGRIATTIIAIAPLFGNAAVIYGLCRFVFADFAAPLIEVPNLAVEDVKSVADFFERLGEWGGRYADYFIQAFARLDFTDWRVYVFLFLVMSLGAHAAPSPVDLKHFFGAIVPIVVILVLVGWLLATYGPASWGHSAAEWIGAGVQGLTGVVALSVVFCLVALAINYAIYLAVLGFRKLTGNR